MNALSNKKTTGFDNVSSKLIQPMTMMTEIINASINAYIFLDPWKVARVVPLFKGGSNKNIYNYRTVSILFILSKVLDKYISDCFKQFLDVH